MSSTTSTRSLAGTAGARRSLNLSEQARIAQAVEAALECARAREHALSMLT